MFKWSRPKTGPGWRIGYGDSNFLVAEGANWAVTFGEELFRRLQAGELSFTDMNKRDSGLGD